MDKNNARAVALALFDALVGERFDTAEDLFLGCAAIAELARRRAALSPSEEAAVLTEASTIADEIDSARIVAH